ncbi:MAG: hypothetical protein WC284_11505 [Candidimonas sp.]
MMRFQDISESYFKNLKPLQEMAKEILNNSTLSVKPNKVVTINSPFSDDFIDEIYKNFGKEYGNLAVYVNDNIPINLLNMWNTKKGLYSHSARKNYSNMDEIRIFLWPILGSLYDDDVEMRTIHPNEIKSNNSIQTTLVHELRHVMQRQTYPDYYHKWAEKQTHSDTEYNYSRDPIEIDAAFIHHLHDETNTSNIHEFVKSVMERFLKYKRLSKKQLEHYKRQAAKYYYTNISKPLNPMTTPKQRLQMKKLKEVEMAKNKILSVNTNPLSDLRNIGHSSENRFFWPTERFDVLLRKFLNGEKFSELNEKYMVVYLSFINKLEKIPYQVIFNLRDIKINDVIEWASTYDFQGFDREFIISSLKELT